MGDAISQASAVADPSRKVSLVALYSALVATLAFVLLWSITSGRYHVPFGTVLTIISAYFVDVKTTWTSRRSNRR